MTCCKCCTHCLTDSLLKWSRLCFLLFPLLVQIRIHVPNAALDWVATLSTHQTCKQFVFVSFYICIFRWLSYSYLTDAGLDSMHISQEISLPNKLLLGKDGGTQCPLTWSSKKKLFKPAEPIFIDNLQFQTTKKNFKIGPLGGFEKMAVLYVAMVKKHFQVAKSGF